MCFLQFSCHELSVINLKKFNMLTSTCVNHINAINLVLRKSLINAHPIDYIFQSFIYVGVKISLYVYTHTIIYKSGIISKLYIFINRSWKVANVEKKQQRS